MSLRKCREPVCFWSVWLVKSVTPSGEIMSDLAFSLAQFAAATTRSTRSI